MARAEIEPALTAEEWASILKAERPNGRGIRDGGLYTEIAGYEVRLWPPGHVEVVDTDGWYYSHRFNLIHGQAQQFAAICLHNQPFGFTREDVEHIKISAASHAGSCLSGSTDVARYLYDIAARISALLPPEEK